VVLIRLRIKSADLPLTERVIKGRVDLVRRNVQAGSGGAIHVEMHADAIVLLIGGDVGHLGQLAQLSHHFCSPLIQLRDIGIFQCVLVLRPADAIVHREVLDGLKIKVDPWNLINASLETSYHFGCGEMALVNRFEIDLDPSTVQGSVGAIGPDEGGEALDCWIFEDFLAQLLLLVRHGCKGDGFGRLGDALESPGVLGGEKALGDLNVLIDGQAQ
jgi:hypothetical protein